MKLRKKNAKNQSTPEEKNNSTLFCDKRTDEYCEHEENAEDKSKTTPHREGPDEEPISWSDLEKTGVYALLMFICTGIIVTLTLVTLLYRERLGVSTESEQRFMDFISKTLFL